LAGEVKVKMDDYTNTIKDQSNNTKITTIPPKRTKVQAQRGIMRHLLGLQRRIRKVNDRVRSFATAANVQGTIPNQGRGMAEGQFAEVHRTFVKDDVQTFGSLIFDFNPLHQSWDMADLPLELQSHPLITHDTEEQSHTTNAIVHGMLVSSLFSCIFGTLVPGAVYMKQSLEFRSPVYVDEKLVGRVDVTRVRQFKTRGVIVTCDTSVRKIMINSCSNSEDLCVVVVGKADVWPPGGSKAAHQ